jgi:hypothetical protein
VRRFSVSRRAKGILAGVAFLFSVGAVSTKLLSGRTNEFCFCLPPVSQPAFTMPEETTADAAIHGGALPGRVVAAGSPVDVTVIAAPPASTAVSSATGRMRDRDLAHLGVLWGTSNHLGHASSSSRGHFAGGGSGGGGMMMGGGHSTSTTKKETVAAKPPAPKSSHAAAPPSHPSAPGAVIPPTPVAPVVPTLPPAAPIVPPTDMGSTFGSNTDPVPGFGNGTPAPIAGGTPGSVGTVGGPAIGSPGKLSVTPEPTMVLLMITGVVALLIVRRREDEANS